MKIKISLWQNLAGAGGRLKEAVKVLMAVTLLVVTVYGLGAEAWDAAYAASEKKVDALSYRMYLKLDTKKNALNETVVIRFRNNTGKTVREIWIRDMTPAVLKYDMKNYPENNKGLKTRISSVTLSGSSKKLMITYKKNKSAVRVDLGASGKVKPGETRSVRVKLRTDIPNREDRFGYQKTKKGKLYALSFCFPYLADNKNGKWQLDPYFDDGESRSSDLADYTVTFRAPKSYKVAATGRSKTQAAHRKANTGSKTQADSRKANKGSKPELAVTTVKACKVRDFAIVACNFMSKDSFKVKGIKVNNYYLKGGKKARYRRLTKLVAKDSIKLFTEKIGRYPYDELDIVPCLFGFGFGGMEFPGLVMTNASTTFSGSLPDYWSLSDGLSHEIGHQWFYAAVGNSEYREGWIDEGFTSYIGADIYGMHNGAAYKYLRKIDDLVPSIKAMKAERDYCIKTARDDYKGMFLNVAPNKYPKWREYGEGEYHASYYFLEEVRLKMGDREFARFLKGYYRKYKMKTVTTKDVVKFIKKYDNSRKMQKIISFYIK